ncbi:acireductone dioxygenase [Pseudomonas sp. MAFF212428]|uniref:Acireductone dioxygenase n=1 Tax=Pseudomonas brassicae TaxID=2708063 RepID=A0A6B3P073_9PSED|nr:acireductone dioxygenase [Pseudomonas brassicae]NER61815.1 acireductone dioxygenase [Pseudomonas brassicae]NER65790.1 acireductone dioxygenase [Pseudomonas brassicae]
MSCLSVYHQSTPDIPNKVLTHLEDIAATLAEHGVRFERWSAQAPVQAGTGQDGVLAAYRGPIDRLMTERGYRHVDVISTRGEQAIELLDEHTYDEDLVRFFAAGRGQISVRAGEYVYAVYCEKGDLIVVPAGTRVWIDGGEHPHCVAVRLFNQPQGLVARLTGDKVAQGFARLDD